MSDVEGATVSRGARCEGTAPCQPREFSQGELLELVSAGSDWIWETDAELRFSWLSENYEAVTGIQPTKMLGRFRFDFLKQASGGSKNATAHIDDLQARRPFRNFVYELMGGSEDCRWVSITGFPRYDAAGIFLGYLGIGRNATSGKASFEELQKECGQSALRDAAAGYIAGSPPPPNSKAPGPNPIAQAKPT